jgi:phosphoserine phosphatase
MHACVKRFRKLITYGIGDSPNDLSMLEMVDIPILVKKVKQKNVRSTIWRDVLNQILAFKPAKNGRGITQ